MIADPKREAELTEAYAAAIAACDLEEIERLDALTYDPSAPRQPPYRPAAKTDET